jgi:hypothetical protein
VEKINLIYFFKTKSSAKPKDISQIPPLQTALSSAMPTPFIANPSENIRLLGVTLDTTLSFTSHLAQAASAGCQVLESFNFLMTTSLNLCKNRPLYCYLSNSAKNAVWKLSLVDRKHNIPYTNIINLQPDIKVDHRPST